MRGFQPALIQDTASMCSRVPSPQLISILAYGHSAVEGAVAWRRVDGPLGLTVCMMSQGMS